MLYALSLSLSRSSPVLAVTVPYGYEFFFHYSFLPLSHLSRVILRDSYWVSLAVKCTHETRVFCTDMHTL